MAHIFGSRSLSVGVPRSAALLCSHATDSSLSTSARVPMRLSTVVSGCVYTSGRRRRARVPASQRPPRAAHRAAAARAPRTTPGSAPVATPQTRQQPLGCARACVRLPYCRTHALTWPPTVSLIPTPRLYTEDRTSLYAICSVLGIWYYFYYYYYYYFYYLVKERIRLLSYLFTIWGFGEGWQAATVAGGPGSCALRS